MNGHRMLRRLGLGVLLAWTAAAAPAAAPGDLSGTWKLNRDASDDPRKKMQEAQEQGDGSGGRGSSGWSGGRHGGHRGGGGAPSDDGGPPPSDTAAAKETLRIEHQDPRLAITDATGRQLVVYTDGRKTEEEHSSGGTTKITGRWKDGFVVLEIEPEHGPSRTETYSVTADGKRLTIMTRFKGRGSRGDVEIRRVYDAASPEEEPAPEAAPQPTGLGSAR
jgi:hypothetical protein